MSEVLVSPSSHHRTVRCSTSWLVAMSGALMWAGCSSSPHARSQDSPEGPTTAFQVLAPGGWDEYGDRCAVIDLLTIRVSGDCVQTSRTPVRLDAQGFVGAIAEEEGQIWAFIQDLNTGGEARAAESKLDGIVQVDTSTGKTSTVWQRTGRTHRHICNLAAAEGRAFFADEDGVHAVVLGTGEESLVLTARVPRWCGVQRVGNLLVTTDEDRGLLWFRADGTLVGTTSMNGRDAEVFATVDGCVVVRRPGTFGASFRTYSPPGASGAAASALMSHLPRAEGVVDLLQLGDGVFAVSSSDKPREFWIRGTGSDCYDKVPGNYRGFGVVTGEPHSVKLAAPKD